MAQAWDSKSAIIKDLVNLGNRPIVDISNHIHEKPPPYVMLEDTEEEYYRQWSGGAPSGDGPDLDVISKMLSMRHHVEEGAEEGTKELRTIEITKLNALAPEFQPSAAKDCPTKISPGEIEKLATELKEKILSAPETLKGKRQRNVAVASLLKVNAGIFPNGFGEIHTDKQTIKLLKPIDFMIEADKDMQQNPVEPDIVADTKTDVTTGTENGVTEVKNCMDNQVRKGPVMAFPTATAMFKRKSSPKPPSKSPITAKPTYPESQSKKFVPSEHSLLLYKEFKEKASLKAAVKNDIWTHAMALMKEKEAKMQQPGQFSLVLANGVQKQFPSMICLPQPRHLLNEDECVVCKVLCRETVLADDAVLARDTVFADGAVLARDTVHADDAVLARDTVHADDAVLARDTVHADDAVLARDTVLADDAVLARDTVLADDTVPARDTVLADDAVLARDTVLADDTVPARDTVLADDAVLARDTVLADDTVPARDTVLADDAVLARDTVLADNTVLVRDTALHAWNFYAEDTLAADWGKWHV